MTSFIRMGNDGEESRYVNLDNVTSFRIPNSEAEGAVDAVGKTHIRLVYVGGSTDHFAVTQQELANLRETFAFGDKDLVAEREENDRMMAKAMEQYYEKYPEERPGYEEPAAAQGGIKDLDPTRERGEFAEKSKDNPEGKEVPKTEGFLAAAPPPDASHEEAKKSEVEVTKIDEDDRKPTGEKKRR